jgi:hypothetical protein
MSQQVSYPLSKVVTSEDSPTVAFYSGVLRRSPLLEDNFSSSLTIEKVRVLQGTASTDPVTGKFAIKDACASGGCPKPSRIVFAMDYWPGRPVPSSYQYTCYADLSLEAPADGNFIQSRCPMFVDATPAYLHSFPQTEITWLVEFRANDGAVLPTGADLGIEFTIH